ncbi:hypothetical protein ACFQZE_06620 [Paenibacillus sp. GCM10027627]|uniref:hypothetical protein n=1 Tax=unclassified Paenibacillus TaxID=185978 RepID=UPI00362F7B20
MEEIYYAIRMLDGGYVRFQQENNWSVDAHSNTSIRFADMWKKDTVVQIFNDLLKGHDERIHFDFRIEATPKEIVKVTMQIDSA